MNRLIALAALLVCAVKGFGLCGRQLQALLRHDAEPVLFEDGVDLAREVPPGRVGLEDGQGAFGHGCLG